MNGRAMTTDPAGKLGGRRVLVTGAGGFIGSHLVETLVRREARVRAFVRYNSRGNLGQLENLSPEIMGEVEVCQGDLCDAEAIRKAVTRCQTVFHLAAVIAIPYSYIHPMEFVQTNVLGTAHVLNACLGAGVERLVHASTSEVYGTAQYVPMDEAHPLQAQSPYAATKIAADQLVGSYHCAFGLPVTIVRPFNTYGPRQSARAVIPTIIVQALANRPIELGSLSPSRDLTYVDDTVAGFIAAAASSEAVGEVLNLGAGEDVSVEELARTVLGLMGKDLPLAPRPERMRPPASEVLQLRSDNRKARGLLGWSPQVTLGEGLKRTIDWVTEHSDLYRAEVYQV